MITSKSLFHSNIVVLFQEQNFVAPDNSAFGSLYGGDAAKGARFFDDPLMQIKELALPAMNLKISLEKQRLRIEDLAANEPQSSILVQETLNICQKLFPQTALAGFGFNFDLFFRFNTLLPIKDAFARFFGNEPIQNADLRDFGFQFTLDRGNGNFDVYFLKVTSPLELAAHLNRHFNEQKLPQKEKLQKMLENCYNDVDKVVGQLKF